MQRITQNSCETSSCNGLVYHRMANTRRLHWRPSSLMLCSGQGQLEQDAQGCVQSGFQCLHEWRVYNISEQPEQVLSYSHRKKKQTCFLMFRQNLLCFSLWPLPLVLSLGTTERAWHCLLYIFPSGIYIH